MPTIDHERLPALITKIEAEITAIGDAPAVSGSDGYEAFRAHLQKCRITIDDLVRSEGAVYRSNSHDGARLRLAGVATTATGGDHAVLRNWINAASRHIDAKGAF